MLWTIIVVLLLFWLLGFSVNIGGGLIHLVLVVVVVLIILQLLGGRNVL